MEELKEAMHRKIIENSTNPKEMEDSILGMEGEDINDYNGDHMDLDGIGLCRITNACQWKYIQLIPREHMAQVQQALKQTNKDTSLVTPRYGSTTTSRINTIKMKSLKTNPHDEKCQGCKNIFVIAT